MVKPLSKFEAHGVLDRGRLSRCSGVGAATISDAIAHRQAGRPEVGRFRKSASRGIASAKFADFQKRVVFAIPGDNRVPFKGSGYI